MCTLKTVFSHLKSESVKVRPIPAMTANKSMTAFRQCLTKIYALGENGDSKALLPGFSTAATTNDMAHQADSKMVGYLMLDTQGMRSKLELYGRPFAKQISSRCRKQIIVLPRKPKSHSDSFPLIDTAFTTLI